MVVALGVAFWRRAWQVGAVAKLSCRAHLQRGGAVMVVFQSGSSSMLGGDMNLPAC